MPREDRYLYLQWLSRYKPAPTRYEPWLTIVFWVLCVSIVPGIGIEDYYWEAQWRFCLDIFGICVLIGVFDFLFFLPRCLQNQFAIPAGRDVLDSALPASSISVSLRRWATTIWLRHVVPPGLALLLCFLASGTDLGKLAAAIPLYLVYRLMLAAGMCAAALPRFFTSTGLICLGFLILLYQACFVPAYYVTSEIYSAIESAKIVAPPVHLSLPPPMPWFYVGVSVPLLVFVVVLDMAAPRLLQMRRQGRWQ